MGLFFIRRLAAAPRAPTQLFASLSPPLPLPPSLPLCPLPSCAVSLECIRFCLGVRGGVVASGALFCASACLASRFSLSLVSRSSLLLSAIIRGIDCACRSNLPSRCLFPVCVWCPRRPVCSLPLPPLDAFVSVGFYANRKRKKNEIECAHTPFSTLS